MKSEQFVFWLQGLFELADPKTLNEKQTQLIKQHLNLVFFHEIDPSYTDDPKIQETMNNIHDGKIEDTMVKPFQYTDGEDKEELIPTTEFEVNQTNSNSIWNERPNNGIFPNEGEILLRC